MVNCRSARDMRRLAFLFALIGCEAKQEQQPASRSSPSATGSASHDTTSCGDKVVGEEGIGQLRIGASVDSIRQKCKVVRDTTVQDSEGMLQREIVVVFSRDTVTADIVSGRVWRIAVGSPGLQTADSLRVGKNVARLLQLKNPRGMVGEGEFFVASSQHCGMSFRLALAGHAVYRGDLDRAGLARLPASTIISEVLVFGCHLRPR